MNIYVYVYACNIHTYIHTYIYIHTYTHTSVCIHTHTYMEFRVTRYCSKPSGIVKFAAIPERVYVCGGCSGGGQNKDDGAQAGHATLARLRLLRWRLENHHPVQCVQGLRLPRALLVSSPPPPPPPPPYTHTLYTLEAGMADAV